MSVVALIAALAVVFPDPAMGQGTRALAESIAAGVMTYSDEAMPGVLCIRLQGTDGQVTAAPAELSRLVRNKLLLARAGAPAPEILGGCGEGFGSDGGEMGPGSGMALVASIRQGGDRPSAVWIDLPGPGLRKSLTCSLPETVRMTMEIQSECSPRTR